LFLVYPLNPLPARPNYSHSTFFLLDNFVSIFILRLGYLCADYLSQIIAHDNGHSFFLSNFEVVHLMPVAHIICFAEAVEQVNAQ
ncbi:MAG: hypothetical protein QWI73_06160, partial [Alphaproteobacteria bacterium]|nr:hypothetical protein [Alphaproteobacteria bacterium]